LIVSDLESLGSFSKQVQVRRGLPSLQKDLDRVSAGFASHILVTPNRNVESERLTMQVSALEVALKTSQPNKQVGRSAGDIHICVADVDKGPELNDIAAQPGIGYCPRQAFSEGILALEMAQPGIIDIYRELFDQVRGTELYTVKVENKPWLQGLPFREMTGFFPDSIPIGIIRRGKKDVLNPDPSTVVEQEASLVILAWDSKYKILPKSADSGTLVVNSTDSTAMKDVWQSVQMLRQRVLLLNWNKKLDPLADIERALPKNSYVRVLSPRQCGIPSSSTVRFDVRKGSCFSFQDIKAQGVPDFDTIVVNPPSDKLTPHESDSQVLAIANLVFKALSVSKDSLAMKEENDRPDIRLVAMLHTRQGAVKLHKTAQSYNINVEVEPILSSNLEAGAAVQILWNPELQVLCMASSEHRDSGTKLVIKPVCRLSSKIFWIPRVLKCFW